MCPHRVRGRKFGIAQAVCFRHPDAQAAGPWSQEWRRAGGAAYWSGHAARKKCSGRGIRQKEEREEESMKLKEEYIEELEKCEDLEDCFWMLAYPEYDFKD